MGGENSNKASPKEGVGGAETEMKDDWKRKWNPRMKNLMKNEKPKLIIRAVFNFLSNVNRTARIDAPRVEGDWNRFSNYIVSL